VDNSSSLRYISEPPPEDREIGARALIQEIQDILSGVPILLIGSKGDTEREVSKDEAVRLQETIGAVKYMEYSHLDWDAMQAILFEAVRQGDKHLETVPLEDNGTSDFGPGNPNQSNSKCCVVL